MIPPIGCVTVEPLKRAAANTHSALKPSLKLHVLVNFIGTFGTNIFEMLLINQLYLFAALLINFQ
jgi:hypothetical protein